MKHTTMTLDDREYVVILKADFDALIEAAEDAEDELAGIAAINARDDAMTRGEHLTMPRDQWARISNGEHPMAVVREYRGLTQKALADASGVKQPEISAIEAHKRRGSIDTLKAIARALKAPLDVIAGE